MDNYLNHTSVEHNVFQALKSIIGVALVYFIFATISAQISSITDFTQSLSLNSGFALAVILTMRPARALMGIVIGVLSLNIQHVVELETVNTAILIQLFVPAFIVAIQSYIGLKVYRKWVSLDNSLNHDSDLLRFLKVIPLIAVVNTLFSLFTSKWLMSFQDEFFISAWINLWIGHLLGLILIIPVAFSLLEQKNALWKKRKYIIVSNFIASLVITFLVCNNIKSYENSRVEDRFKVVTNQTATLFQISLKEKELLQASVAQLIVSSEEVTRAEFKQFVSGLSLENKYIQVVEWLPKIKIEQRAEYENEQRKYFGDNFSITEIKEKGVLIPARKRATYFPITFLEPEWDNDSAKGFDASASVAGRAIIKKAIISGVAQAREPIQIVRNSGFKDTFIVYKPVYKTFDGTKTLDPSEGEAIGFVNIIIRIEEFVATVVGAAETANFNLQWQDVETGKYYFNNEVTGATPFKHVINIHLSGRDMKLIFTPTATFIEQAATELIAIAMITSFVLASLFSILILNITARTSRIQREVKLRTKELEAANQKLELLSNKDALTNLFNRRYFEKALHDEFERSLRYKSMFALIMFDIDNFKKINDQYGHPFGDKVIKAVADYLINTSRSSDVSARVGGEEFSLILPAQTDTHVMSIVERMRIDMSNIEVKDDQHTVRFTCSFGIAIFDENIKDIHTLIKMADQAMYKAKTSGRNRTKLFTDL